MVSGARISKSLSLSNGPACALAGTADSKDEDTAGTADSGGNDRDDGGASSGVRRLGGVLLAGIAALLPFAGLHLFPYVGLLGLALLLVGGRSALRVLVPVAIGVVIGSGLFAGLHAAAGTWPYLVGFVTGQAGEALGLKALRLWGSVTRDVGLLLLLPAVWLGRKQLPMIRLGGRRIPVVWLAWPVLPVVMTLVGKYPRYYGWMAFAPVLLCALRGMGGMGENAEPGTLNAERGTEDGDTAGHRGRWHWVAVACALVALLPGLPARLAICALEWNERDPAVVTEAAAGHVTPGRVVCGEVEAYYAVVQNGGTFVSSGYVARMSQDERAGISLALLRPDSRVVPEEHLGGRWVKAGAASTATPGHDQRWRRARLYDLVIWRREANAQAD